MDSASWTLLFLVPSSYVATNTVALINTTVHIVLLFAVIMLVVTSVVVYIILQIQKNRTVAAEKQNRAELERLNAELAEASKAKSEFLANMSHDIRTPMNAIVGISSLMESEKGVSDKLHSYIQKIQMSSRHLLGLINDVLDMSKIEAHEVTLNSEPVSLAEQIGQVDSIIRSQTQEKGQDFIIRVHKIYHEYLIGDSIRLRQIFINLLSNAVKYTPKGGKVFLDLTELPCDDPDKAKFLISVTDTGYGMTPEFLEHVFEPFVRAENSVTNKVQGTGLGMAITKNLVDLQGGDIKVQSEVGKGSRVDVTLTYPIDRNRECFVDAENILIISDEGFLVDNVRAALSAADVTLFAVDTVEATSEILEENTMDIILLAGMSKDRTLNETVDFLREKDKKAVLIFCTDYAQREQVEGQLSKVGVDGFVSRPFFLSTLMATVDRAAGRQVAEVKRSRSSLNGMRFMCAEDNQLNAEILEAILKMNGATCVTYKNGKELVDAFESVKPGEFNAVLMDVQMPVMNGLDATRAIRAGKNPLGRKIPIIAMTANAFVEDIRDCLEAGMDAHIAKPIDIDLLERAMRAFYPPETSNK